MRITESRLRSVISNVIKEMSHDAKGHYTRPNEYVGMGGSPSPDLNDRYLVAIADVCMGKSLGSYDIDRMCKEIEECDPSLKMWCDELPEQIRTENKRGVLDCLYNICKNHECCKICIKCCS